jgi:hypothetical protein
MAVIAQTPATLDIVAVKGDDLTVTLSVTESSVAYDWTGATVATAILDSTGATVATNFTTATPANGTLTMSLSDANTTTLGVGSYRYWLSVTKSSATRTWLAGLLTVMETGWGGTSSSSASLSITTGSVSLTTTTLVASAAANISVADASGYWQGTNVEAVLAEVAVVDVLVFDHFDRHANGDIATKVPVVGAAWRSSGSGLPTVTSGLLSSSANGYAYIDCVETPQTIAAGVRWTNPDTNFTATLAWMTGATGSTFAVANIGCHFNFGPTGYSVTIVQATTSYTLMSGTWTVPMLADVTYPVTATINGGRLTITANGDVRTSAYDVRLTTLVGPIVWWQSMVIGSASTAFAWAFAAAASDGVSTVPQLSAAARSSESIGSRGQVVGNADNGAQTMIGYSTQDNVSPGINFGASTIRTYLSSAVSISATTFQSPIPIPSGSSVVFTGGTGAETLTTTGFPTGSGPYTHTTTAAFTKAHLANASVIATPTASFRNTMYLSLANGYFYLPNNSVLCAPNGNLYLGTALDTFLRRVNVNIAGMGSGDSFQVDGTWNGGMLIMGAYYLWVDSSGRLRIKSGAPTSDTDGTVIGTQT